jgi:iron complex outermembrane recepter protein
MNRRTLVCRAVGLPLAAMAALALSTEAWSQVDEIIVTTRKREEAIQDVPIAVSAISSEEMEAKGLTNIDDIARQTSSVIFQQGFSPQDTKIVVRGLSPDRGRVNVAVLIDGVDITGESVQTVGGSLLVNPQLFDIERVEIVKGPQNALYGRSAYNGAISYITKKPAETFEAGVDADVGDYGQRRAKVRVSGPLLGDMLLGSLSGMIHNHDGFWSNGITGNSVGGSDGWAAAGTLQWNVTEKLTATFRVTHSDDDYEVQPWAWLTPNRQFEIPAAARNDGVLVDCSDAEIVQPNWPFPTTNCAEPVSATTPSASNASGGVSDVGALVNRPGILPFITGFWPGRAGVFPSAGALGGVGTMSEDERTCSDPGDASTCEDFRGAGVEVTRGTLDVNWDFGPMSLRSLTHAATSDAFQEHDSNANGSQFSSVFISQVRFVTDTDLFSQELQLSSTGDNTIDWTVGGQFWREELKQSDFGTTCLTVFHASAPSPTRPFTPCGPIMANIGPQGDFPSAHERWFRDTDHLSAYFLVDWEFAEGWDIALEGRYVDETRPSTRSALASMHVRPDRHPVPRQPVVCCTIRTVTARCRRSPAVASTRAALRKIRPLPPVMTGSFRTRNFPRSTRTRTRSSCRR